MKISFESVCQALKINPAEQRDKKKRKSSGIWTKTRHEDVWKHLEQSARSSFGVGSFNRQFRKSAVGQRIDKGIKRILTDVDCDQIEIDTKPPKRSRSLSLGSTDAQQSETIADQQLLVDDLRKQICQLQNKNDEYRKQVEEIRSFFNGEDIPTRENNSGRKKIFTPKTDAGLLRMLSAGVSGRGIATMLQIVADCLPSLFDGQTSTPSVSYVNKLRGAFATLARGHIQHFVAESTCLTLHMDAFPCRAGTSFLGVGVSNEQGKFVAIDFAPFSERKTAKNVTKAVEKIMNDRFDDFDEMKKKVTGIMTDSEHTQRLANKKIIENIFDKRHIVEFPCSLHGASGLEKKTIAAMRPEVSDVLHVSKILFGSRLNSGYRRFSLKAKLQALAGLTRRNSTSLFQTDSGSRVHVSVNNAQSIISQEHNVLLCATHGSTMKNPHAKKLKEIMEHGDWTLIKSQLAFIALMWRSVCNPMFQVLSRPQTQQVAAKAWKDAITKLKTAKDAKISVAELRSNVHDTDEEFLKVIDNLLKKENAALLEKCKSRFKTAIIKCLKKLEKEHKLIVDLNDESEALYPCSNSAQEGSFGRFKNNQDRYAAMTSANLEGMSLAQVNDTIGWLEELPENVMRGEINQAKSKRRDIAEKELEKQEKLIEKTLSELVPFQE